MIVPKQRVSKSKGRMRRANWKLEMPDLIKCPQCHVYKSQHTVCKECGFYKGKEIIKV
ncbi:MAG: 50S ribosomal protein L32 [Oscillospiraceae bacterium]|nr:50S ribosomal protein L32 [Oscillospiraceae bacterium]